MCSGDRSPLPDRRGLSGSNAYVALLHQHELAAGPKTLGNPKVDVGLPVVGGPVQGRPVNGFVPVDMFRFGVVGETGVSRGWATVFPLITGLTVFPLSSGLLVLVFCASDTVVVKVRTRTLRPNSSRRFAVMVDLPFGSPKASTLNSCQGCVEEHRMTARRFPPPWSVLV
jgi:hypothetical protein